MRNRARVGSLTHLYPPLGGPPHELLRYGRRLRHAILAADHGRQHVVRPQSSNRSGIDVLDGHTECALHRHAFEQPLAPLFGGSHEQVPDRVEERRPELPKQGKALPHERDLLGGGELLSDAAHRLSGRAGSDLRAVGEDDVPRAQQSQVVRDARADRAGAGYDNSSSHASSSRRSSSVSRRSGPRTSSRTGTPRLASTRLSAACRG